MIINNLVTFVFLLWLITGCSANSVDEPAQIDASSDAPTTEETEASIVNTRSKPKPPSVTIKDQGLTDQQLETYIQQGLFHQNIVQVELSGNQITSAGVQAILSTPLHSLQVLNLYNNQIGDEGANLIAQSEKLAGVNRLLVGNNGITQTGLEALLGPESRIVGPTWIDISGSDMGDEGLHIILDRPNLEYLEGLSVRRTGITDDGANAIAHVAEKMNNLRYLDVSGNELTDAGRTVLTNSPHLKNTKILFE